MSNQAPNSRRTCDIVMKGGITSGVVYPQAIVSLSRRFDFKNVGGTSAGAIAAAAATAAEARRVRTGSDEGFTELAKLGGVLGGNLPDGSGTRLLSLFQPQARTRRLFAVLLAAVSDKESPLKTGFKQAVRQYLGAMLLGASLGLALTAYSLSRHEAGFLAWVSALAGILLAIAGGVAAIVFSFGYQVVHELPRNKFGLCSGMPDDVTAKLPAEPLTAWLAAYLNNVAGFKSGHRPLVFGDLWNPLDKKDRGDARDVNLEMMTTNLTHGRPYRLPFRDDDDLHENHLFFFQADEFRGLFPVDVVQWMIDHPRRLPATPAKLKEEVEFRERIARDGFHCMPAPADLPVIVATRLSLSFPFLLSAIPLHAIDRLAPRDKQVLERCWFTDGGLCSNLPLHFFDAPLPRRPTFSIDLTEKPDDTPDSELVPTMDDTAGTEPMDRWNRFDRIVSANPTQPTRDKPDFGKLTGFTMTMITTMQNWNDATASRLPGCRDRIVRIPLTSKQGGLNLAMEPEVVTFLTRQGDKCAALLREHFDVPAVHDKMTWENHRWIRLRAMLAALEKMVQQTVTACDYPESGDISYEDWLTRLSTSNADTYAQLSYQPTKKQIAAALDTLARVRALQQVWVAAGSAADGAPKPRPILRPRPQI